MGGFTFGFAARDITPERDRRTLYDAPVGDPRPTRDEDVPVRDRLHARATVIGREEPFAAFVTLDLLCVTGDLRSRIIARLQDLPVPPENIVLSATHTHTAPSVVHFRGFYPTPEEYLNLVASEAAEAIRAACHSRTSAQIAFGKTRLDASVNRRQIGRLRAVNEMKSPTGLVDPEVVVARIGGSGANCMGVLFNYAAHPLTMCARAPLISADYPGRAVRVLEEHGVGFAQFLQGCAGDVNVKIWGDEEEANAVGCVLASAVMDAAKGAVSSTSTDLSAVARRIRLPLGPVPTSEDVRDTLERLRREKAMGPKRVTGMMLEWAEDLSRALDAGTLGDSLDVLVQVLRVGDAIFVALPGEVFAEIGLTIKKRAGGEHLFVIAYANNCEVGYIPTRAAYSEGGYEVAEAPVFYGLLLPPSPTCAEMLVDAALEMIERVRQSG